MRPSESPIEAAISRQPSFAISITIGGALLATVSVLLFLAFFATELPRPGRSTRTPISASFSSSSCRRCSSSACWRFPRARGSSAAGGSEGARRRWRPGRGSTSTTRGSARRVRRRGRAHAGQHAARVSTAAYKGVEAMDSVGFCGQVCHEVMEPEFVAYQNGPHARVNCVVVPHRTGRRLVRQVEAVGHRARCSPCSLNTHSRPIAVTSARPAAGPGDLRAVPLADAVPWRQARDQARVRRRRGEHRVGDHAPPEHWRCATPAAQPRGIHWHVADQNAVEYIAMDAARQQIGYVKLTAPDGKTHEYFAEGVTEAQLAAGERRRMDCVDCHNRPSHIFARSADRAINEAMAAGAVAKDLPFIRREAAVALKAEYPDRATADAQIAGRLRGVLSRRLPGAVDLAPGRNHQEHRGACRACTGATCSRR